MEYSDIASGGWRFGDVKNLTLKEWKAKWTEFHGKQKRYCYLITFTIDPKNVSKDFDYDQVESYIRKQFKRKPLKVKEAHIVREGDGVEKHIHWHVAAETLKPLAKDRFSYYEKLYGYVDKSVSKTQNLQDALQYMSKEGTPQSIL